MSSNYGNHRARKGGNLTVALISVATATTGIWLYKNYISKYGWDGTCWLIWEGSPYPPNIRDRAETLDEQQLKVTEKHSQIATLEGSLQRARQAGGAGGDANAVLQYWQSDLSYIGQDISTYLGILSDDLDKIAAKVDSVNTAGKESSLAGIKLRKKALSRQIVDLMKRADTLISYYNQIQTG